MLGDMTTTTTNRPLDTTAATPPSSMWTATRLVVLLFTVLEVLLLARLALKLFGADPEQALVSGLYALSEPLMAPFRGIFAQPAGAPVFEIATLVAIVFFVLVGALVAAIIQAFTGRRADATI
jgi:uncharacterized protein YggT (Ycf19 family)